jgi:hypothetical protein
VIVIAVALLSGCGPNTSSIDEEPVYEFVMRSTPLEFVLMDYAEVTGIRVDIVKGVDAQITVRTERKLTKTQYQDLLHAKLKEQNVGLFPIASNRMVAAWIDISKVPKPTPKPVPRRASTNRTSGQYQGMLERRQAQMRERARVMRESRATNSVSSGRVPKS